MKFIVARRSPTLYALLALLILVLFFKDSLGQETERVLYKHYIKEYLTTHSGNALDISGSIK